MVAEGAFLEWAEYAGNLYVSSRAPIEEHGHHPNFAVIVVMKEVGV